MTRTELSDLEAELLLQLEEALPRAVASLRAKQGGGVLIALALCTDEDMLSVYAAGYTAAWAEQHGAEDERYRPAEWPETNQELDAASNLLQAFSSAQYEREPEDEEEHPWKEPLIHRMCDVLERLRANGTVAVDALLLCGAHDCGDAYHAWMSAGVLRMNSPARHALWQKHR